MASPLNELKAPVKKQLTKNLLQDKTCKNCIHRLKNLSSTTVLCMKYGKFDTCCAWESDMINPCVTEWQWDDGSKSKWRWRIESER